MSEAKTLLQLAGADLTPPKMRDACLILIDLQNEYREGPIAVPGADAAIASAARLLAAARKAGAPVFHVAHRGRAGSLFDRTAERGQIVAPLAPITGEALVEKGLPNAFAKTDLERRVAAAGRTNVIVAGFMTHMCVSSTARAALDLGLRVTIPASACGTRDLPDGKGGVIEAATLHQIALVELADRFAIVTPSDAELI